MPDYHLAQANLARLAVPIEHPQVAEFVANIDRINKLGDASPGWVWRFQTAEGDATAVRVFDDPLILPNMTLWESIEALHAYVYKSEHVEFFKRRREWFTPLGKEENVMWWVPAGHRPGIEEMTTKFELLWTHGPTPLAFTFKRRFSVEDFLAAQPSAR